jgi:hypothetical protein
MIQRLWEDHRKLIIQCGAGLVVFLFLNSCISRYVDRAEATDRQSRKVLDQNRRLHKQLEESYAEEAEKVEVYAALEQDLRSAVCLSEPPEIQSAGGSLQIKFDKEIADAWESVLPDANRAGLTLPPRLTSQDFGVQPEDGAVEYKRYYSYLGIVRQALPALVKSGFEELGAVDLVPEEVREVVLNDGVSLLERAVSFQVAGPYESFLKLLGAFQEPGKFLQVRVRNLRQPKGKAADAGGLHAELLFVGLRLEEIAPEAAGHREGTSGARRAPR